jgi:energy-coupling factor transport system permease protein
MLSTLDPRAKLLAGFISMLPLLLDPSSPALLLYLGLLTLGFASDARARRAARQLLPTLWLGFGLVVFTALLTEEGRGWLAGLLPWSAAGAQEGARLALRMIELIAVGVLVSATTPPRQLLDGLEWLLHPLRALKVDVQIISLLVMLVLRFAPLFRAELETTERALFLRGVRFGRGPVEQVRRLTALGIPAISRLLIRSDDLAAGLVTRGFGLAPTRTGSQLRARQADLALLGCAFAVAGIAFIS